MADKTTPPVMAIPPPVVQVGCYRYTVVVDHDAIARASLNEKRALSGHSDFDSQTITLDNQLGPDALAETLLHELLHCTLLMLRTGLECDEEEAIVRPLAYELLDVLRRNPELVAFLTADTAGGD